MINGPDNLTAADTGSAVELAWSDRSTDESGFRIYRRKSTQVTWSRIATVVADVTTYTDTGASAATTYLYMVSAYNAIGSDNSATARVTTGGVTPPDGLKATASGTDASLLWHNHGGTGLHVWRLNEGDGVWRSIATPSSGAVSYNDTVLTAGDLYSYQICAEADACSAAFFPSLLRHSNSPLSESGMYNVTSA